MEKDFTHSPVELAIKAAGSGMKLAQLLGVSHQTVYLWRKTGEFPVGRVKQVSEVTGIPKALLHPDFASER